MQVFGDYELLEKIAEGGMGAVFKARHRETAARVAVKVLSPHLTKNPVLVKRFEKEYNVASCLDHPNIVRALAFGYQDESPYLVMEFVEGESLGNRLQRVGALTEAEAISIITQVAQGLQRAHKEGLVHRDIKPGNILLTADGIVKIADLGLVKELDTDLNLTRTGRGLGTPHFMAPEQFRNAKHVDARSDIYSLGATLYMMVTGEMPFKALGPVEAFAHKMENKLKPVRELVPEISERVDWAIRRAMRSEAGQRPGSCREFIEDLTGRSTRPLEGDMLTGREIWYLRFKDEEGVSHTAQESMMSLRRALKQGLLGDPVNLRASRNQSGPFEPLRKLPEFRDVVLADAVTAPVHPAPAKPASARAAPPSPPALKLPQGMPSTKDNHQPAVQPTAKPSTSENRRPSLAAIRPLGSPMAAEDDSAPYVILKTAGPSFDWGRALLFLLLALVAGGTGFFLLPHFFR